jgi:hypothetical protein
MIVAMAASCAASKEYTSKLFALRTPVAKDSLTMVAKPLRFLEPDSATLNQEGWVSTDIIMGRDTATNTIALDNLAKKIPLTANKADTSLKTEVQKPETKAMAMKKDVPEETVPVARAGNAGEVRTKRTREK